MAALLREWKSPLHRDGRAVGFAKRQEQREPMKAEYDFSKAVRGKFYHPNAVFSFPEYIKARKRMPEVCRFSGIVISMYAEMPARHHAPHFHAYYGEHAAALAIASGDVLAGSLPASQRRAIEAWRRARLTELQTNWERLQARQRINKIAPL